MFAPRGADAAPLDANKKIFEFREPFSIGPRNGRQG
jgi:hypothetical protein